MNRLVTRSMLVAWLLGTGTMGLGQPAFPADRFEEPVPLRVEGEVVEFTDWLAAPALGDFYGEGRKDLLVGQHKGRLRVFRNIGTGDRPEFSGPVWFDEIVPDGRIPTG